MFDALFQQLVDLQKRLDDESIPFILGGGMGLWLRDSFLGGTRQSKYPQRPESRSTEDLDLLLSARVVVDGTAMTGLRDILTNTGFSPIVNYMQFTRSFSVGGQDHEVKVDLLAAPPPEREREKVKINKFRIRPKNASKIHAYLTPEAAGIALEPVTLDISSVLAKDETATVQIPSSLNYLILKLHAFKDRHTDMSEKADGGRHHALDIFRIVTDMRESDWNTALKHLDSENGEEYLAVAAHIQRHFFATNTDLGVLRLKDNKSYRARREEFDQYIPTVLEDLSELFNKVADPDEAVLNDWGVIK